jgi:hypothetical protein
MNSLLNGIILTLFLTQICFAQWFWQNPLPQGNTLRSVKFISSSIGWAVGANGTILKTANGGTNWVQQSSGTTSYLWGVSFTDANTGTTVGTYGTILRTTDGGATWNQQSSGTTNHLFGVSFIDANYGTVVGGYGTILRTTDGGTTWNQQSSRTGGTLRSVSFIDVNYGTVVGSGGAILRTTNGGATFVEEEMIDGIPSEYLVSQNYPNPFNPTTKIRYTVPNSSKVVIKVFDILGKEIETLMNEEKPAGTYEVKWNGSNLPSGVYFYQLKAGTFVETKKMILLR